MTNFRAGFVGKVSPVQFFWGAMDLACTRFSGRSAPAHPGGAPNCPNWVMVEGYSRELSSCGFWPGGGKEGAFYSYAYPAPDGFSTHRVEPSTAYFSDELGEFLLPYEVVRTADDPDRAVARFLQTTYEAAAELADWDRSALRCNQTACARGPCTGDQSRSGFSPPFFFFFFLTIQSTSVVAARMGAGPEWSGLSPEDKAASEVGLSGTSLSWGFARNSYITNSATSSPKKKPTIRLRRMRVIRCSFRSCSSCWCCPRCLSRSPSRWLTRSPTCAAGASYRPVGSLRQFRPAVAWCQPPRSHSSR